MAFNGYIYYYYRIYFGICYSKKEVKMSKRKKIKNLKNGNVELATLFINAVLVADALYDNFVADADIVKMTPKQINALNTYLDKFKN